MTTESGTVGIRVRSASARTHVGLVRTENEDRWGELDQRIFVVADGMGGHEGGEEAAHAAVQAFLEIASASEPDWPVAIAQANETVRTSLVAKGLGHGGCTLVAFCLKAEPVILHVGDSRAYLLRRNETLAEQLTVDHNVEMELRAAGQDPAWYRAQFGRTDALTRYIGGEGTGTPTVSYPEVGPGDRILLSTDGVHDQIAHGDLSACLATGTCADAADALIAAALDAGGPDNATALVLEIGE